MRENVTVKIKVLINGGAAHSIRPTFWGEGDGPVTHDLLYVALQ